MSEVSVVRLEELVDVEKNALKIITSQWLRNGCRNMRSVIHV